MTTIGADLVLWSHRKAIVVVEAKGRPIPLDFEDLVLEQIRDYARASGAEWTLLIDPVIARLYRGFELNEPVVQIPSREVVEAAGLARYEIVGERMLLLAAERWLRSIRHTTPFLERHPALAPFVQLLEQEAPLSAEPIDA